MSEVVGARRHGSAGWTGSPAAQAYVADIPLDDVLHVKLVTLPVARARIGAIDDAGGLRRPRRPSRLYRAPTCRSRCRGSDRSARPAGDRDRRDEVPRRSRRRGRRGDTGRGRGGRGARPGRVRGAPAASHARAALAADAPLVQDPSLRRTTRTPTPTSSTSTVIAWGDVDAAEPTPASSWSRARTSSRWSPSSRSSRTRSWPRPTATASRSGARSSTRTGSSASSPSCSGCRSPKVRVHAPDPGGAFGGKQHAKYEPLLAFMALATGRPVRLVLTLEETFQAVRRGAAEVHVRTGFRRDGTLVFRDLEADYLIGAYADIADRTVAKGSYTSMGPYAARRRGSSRAACCRTRCRPPRSVGSAIPSRSGRSNRT